MIAVAEKVCLTCDETKPLEAFHRFVHAPDGRQARCGPCRNSGRRVATRERKRKKLLSLATRATKYCRWCNLEKPVSDFYKHASPKPNTDPLDSWCNPCRKEERRAREYGMAPGTYEALLEKQNGVCAICHQKPPKGLAVDHDHATGEVRGLLCQKCNVGLGHFGDDSDRLVAALIYLERTPC